MAKTRELNRPTTSVDAWAHGYVRAVVEADAEARAVSEPEAWTSARHRVEFSDLAARFARFPESHLYVARVSGTTTPVKIGRSINVGMRLRSIQTPAPIELLGTVPEWVVSEAEAHALFDRHRSHGEWFSWSEEMARWVDELPERYAALLPLCVRVRRALRLDVVGRTIPRYMPLAQLERAERKLRSAVAFQERQAERQRAEEERQRYRSELAAERERRQEEGCGLCRRARMVLRKTACSDLWVCGGCSKWLGLYATDPEAGLRVAQTEARELRDRADEKELLASTRIQNLAVFSTVACDESPGSEDA